MKLLILSLILFTHTALAVCLVPISRENIRAGQIPTSTAYNADFDNLYARANSVPGDCLLDLSLRAKQIENVSMGTSHFANASVTTIKIASGTIPSFERPLRIKAFSTSGTWQKLPDVEKVLVRIVGGGGGWATNGGNSSFGTHCIANGGASGSAGGAGGTASNGDLNLTGGAGIIGTGQNDSFVDYHFGGFGGHSFFGGFGQGGSFPHRAGEGAVRRDGGGGGGYCEKYISKGSLEDFVPVTIGAGGTGPANSNPGRSGLLIIYEYGR